ncbi:RDD family protein [Lysobacter sp. TAB13]|uniref:RDD family protein n=1 Tax=Lysobacter sp. TAB13 TaxID=3233065 RepID=UPI003F97F8DE
MTQWYYSDSERNRHGPLDGEAMIERHRRGELGADILVWRDGMSQWRPWREVAVELIADPGFAPAGPSAAATASAPAPGPAPGTAEAVGAGTAAAIAAAIVEAEERQDPRAVSPDSAQSRTATPSQAASADADASPSEATTPAGAHAHSPYAAPRAGVAEDTTVVQGLEVVYAGFWKRLAAYVIDSLLIGITYYAVSTMLFVLVFASGLFGGDAASWAQNAGAGVWMLVVAVYVIIGLISVAYYVGFESSAMQATLGKLAVGVKVVDSEGRRLTRMRALGRWAASLLSYASLCVGFLLIAFTDGKRGLHDMIAKTQVVDRWAYTARPEMQQRTLGPVAWVVLILGGLMWLLVVGLAAFGAMVAAAGH